MNEFQYLINYFKEYPLLIQIVWIFSGILFVGIIVLIIILKYLRRRLRINGKRKKTYQEKYESLLINYLYSGTEEEGFSQDQLAVISQLKICIKDKFKREIVLSSLVKLRNEISGEVADAIQKLYIQIGLSNFAQEKLKNKKWDLIASGIKEFSEFHIEGVQNEVLKHLNHPRKEVRDEVQLYLVKLFNFEGLKFLDTLKMPMSEWEQIQLLEVLQRFKNQEIPDITPWLNSSNDSVVIFALKLAEIYNKFEVKDTLINLLNHGQKIIRVKAIETLNYFQAIEVKPILKNKFIELSSEEKIAFLKLLENLYENNDEPFLVNHIYDDNFEIKKISLKLLKILNVEKFKSLMNSSVDPAFVKIVKFIEN